MTREFWIWQWADGGVYDGVFEGKAQCGDTYFQCLGAEGHPVQLVPKTDIETAQKDAATDHHLVNGLREFYLGYLSQYLPLDVFERVRRTTVTAAAVRILRNVRSEHAAIAAQEKS